ncbi:MAG: flagellar brake protein [Lachnospiraceae bacterium]|nr:flagellar brake protein [Lachnospiraceae bacterium]
MTEAFYKTGDYVELKLLSGRKGKESTETSVISESIITRTDAENLIRIAMPTQRGQASPLEEGEVYELRFIASSGSFACRATVVDDMDAGIGNGFELKLISELTKDCKRMFYRLDKVIPIMFTIAEDENTGQMLGGTCFNLSAGGVRFSSGTDIERGRTIRMNLMLGGEKEDLIVSGRVIYTDNVGLEDAVYEHRVEFTDISADTKERIVRYCFDETCK